MFEVIKLKQILKKYKSIFSDILFGFNFENIEDNKIIFKDDSGNEMSATVSDNIMRFYYQNFNYERWIYLELPSKDKDEDIKAKEIIREVRPNGTIMEQIERTYGFSIYSNEERTLTDLVSNRYVFDRDIPIADINQYNQNVNNLSVMKTTFESHMKVLVKPINSIKWCTDSPYSTHTLLNGTDISNIYDIVNGIDKISRVYDLYNGIINERNANDIFAIHLGLLGKDCLGYKEVCGITEKEDAICVKAKRKIYINQDPNFIHQWIQNEIGYKKAFSCDDLHSLKEAVAYPKTAVEIAKEKIEKALGISYDEFDLLDFDEQQKLNRQYRNKNLNKQQTLEERMDNDSYNKSVTFIKKLTRKIKNMK